MISNDDSTNPIRYGPNVHCCTVSSTACTSYGDRRESTCVVECNVSTNAASDFVYLNILNFYN